MPPRILTIDDFPARWVSQTLFCQIARGNNTGPLTGGTSYKPGEKAPPPPPEAGWLERKQFPYLIVLKERYDADYGDSEFDENLRRQKRARANKPTGWCCFILVEDGKFEATHRQAKNGKLIWNWVNRTKIRFVRAGLENDFKIRSDEIWTATTLNKYAHSGHDLYQILKRQLVQPAP